MISPFVTPLGKRVVHTKTDDRRSDSVTRILAFSSTQLLLPGAFHALTTATEQS